ncbi:hypothetical protein ASF58_23270 [Methylobacterium sp. Leaf125]|uniref:hypothetical protein n=1 Tax=Methylobacterium sp. Leaf125 TaxID=1736265 RepID=UPI0006F46048|nr:hypothetical protein [Methylobacterium sp. Leaf125]KQQ39064.1 hypothetical protein ASF58_23270 [Methylobacterium sp. Leaf125]
MDPTTFKFFQSAWNVFGVLGVISVGACVIAYLAFRFLSLKWLDAKFNERLESYKHAQQRELEHLKYEINSLLDRTVKVHQHEFEVLPDTWRKLTDAFFHTKETTLAFENYTNVARLNDDQLLQILKEDGFRDSDISTIMHSDDRQSAYMRLTTARRIQKTGDVIREFRVYIRKYGIFIRPELRTGFEALEEMIAEAFTEYTIDVRFNRLGKENGKVEKLQMNGEGLYRGLEKHVQDRLWNSLAEPKE